MLFFPIHLALAIGELEAQRNSFFGPVCEWCRTRNKGLKSCQNCGGPRPNPGSLVRCTTSRIISQHLNRKQNGNQEK